jgi:hypothetical protein
VGAGASGVGTGIGTMTTGSDVGGPASGSVGCGSSSLIVVQAARRTAMSETPTAGNRIKDPRQRLEAD